MPDPTEAEARRLPEWMEREFRDARRQHDDLPAWLGGKDGAYHRGVSEGRATEREKVRAAFQDLLDVAEDMLPYVPEYFREKWGHDEGVERARLWLDGAE